MKITDLMKAKNIKRIYPWNFSYSKTYLRNTMNIPEEILNKAGYYETQVVYPKFLRILLLNLAEILSKWAARIHKLVAKNS